MDLSFPIDIDAMKGFLHPDEGAALYKAAAAVCARAPVLEIGSYCGKSTLFLGTACKENDAILYALDHHRGSEEHQPGEMFHDPELFDAKEKQFDSFREFRRNIDACGLRDHVVPIVSSSDVASRYWHTPLSMVFIDGGHSLDAAVTDYRSWAGHIVPGGFLAIHDLFPRPEEGGHAPWAVYRLALASGLFAAHTRVESLGILRRI